MSEDQESSSIPFFIGEVEFQNKDGYLYDMDDNPILIGSGASERHVPIQVKDNPIVNAIHRIVVNGKKKMMLLILRSIWKIFKHFIVSNNRLNSRFRTFCPFSGQILFF